MRIGARLLRIVAVALALLIVLDLALRLWTAAVGDGIILVVLLAIVFIVGRKGRANG